MTALAAAKMPYSPAPSNRVATGVASAATRTWRNQNTR